MRIYSKQTFLRIGLFLTVLLFPAIFVFAQTPAPKQEYLLNGLKILMWNEPKSDKVTLKLRIHSGAMFDPKDKMGTMTLLADNFFPEEGLKTFVTEELDGSLSVTSNYDYLQIEISSRPDSFDKILDILQAAVVNTPITKESFAKLREARLKQVAEDLKNPAIVADQAVAKRLFGNFPYGNPMNGTPESLAKLDKNDLIIAKEKFVTADNSTLAIVGNFDPIFALRACKQFFGAWQKSDKLVPPTFRQPDAPDKAFLAKTEIENVSELRFAIRGLARNDKDFFASQVLAKIWQTRFQSVEGSKASVFETKSLLSGLVTIKVSNWNVGLVKTQGSTVALPGDFFNKVENLLTDIKAEEFEKARATLLIELTSQDIVGRWLDLETYKLPSIKVEEKTLNNLTLADVNKVLAERFKTQPIATVLLISGKDEKK